MPDITTTTPSVSLVIPAFNEEKYIGDCLMHALTNSGGKFHEVIVIDNASTDRTNEIAANFAGVRVVREETKGLTAARQRGFREAKGDVLAFVDADTQMGKGWVDTVIDQFSHNPKLACLSGPYVYYDTSPFQRFAAKWLYWRLMAMPTYFFLGYMAVGGNFAIKREVVEKMGGFDTSIQFYGEDTNIARRAHEFGKVKFMLSLVMPTSGRRLAHEGLMRTAIIYVANFLSEVIVKRPVTNQHTDVR